MQRSNASLRSARPATASRLLRKECLALAWASLPRAPIFVVRAPVLWLAALCSARGLRRARLGWRMYVEASRSPLHFGWVVERVSSWMHGVREGTRLLNVRDAVQPQALVVAITGTWNSSAGRERLRTFIDRVTFGLDADVKVFEWSGRNSEAERIEAGVDLARRLKSADFAGYPKILLVGYSHGGNVARVALTELGEAGKHLRLLLLGVPHAAIRPRDASQDANAASIEGTVSRLVVIPALAICGGSAVAVLNGWVSLELVIVPALAAVVLGGTGFVTWGSNRSRITAKFRDALAARSTKIHAGREWQIAFEKDEVLLLYRRLGALVRQRERMNEELAASRQRRRNPGPAWNAWHGCGSWLIAGLSFTVWTRYFPSDAEWYSSVWIVTGASLLLSAVTSQAVTLAVWRPQRFQNGPSMPIPGGMWFHIGSSQLANVVGLGHFDYVNFEISLDDIRVDLLLVCCVRLRMLRAAIEKDDATAFRA